MFCRPSSSTAPRVSGPAVTSERESLIILWQFLTRSVCFYLKSKTNSRKCCDGCEKTVVTTIPSPRLKPYFISPRLPRTCPAAPRRVRRLLPHFLVLTPDRRPPPWQGQPPPRQAMADLPSGRRRLNWGGDRRPLDSLLTISVLAPIERAAAATQRDDLPDDSRVG